MYFTVAQHFGLECCFIFTYLQSDLDINLRCLNISIHCHVITFTQKPNKVKLMLPQFSAPAYVDAKCV